MGLFDKKKKKKKTPLEYDGLKFKNEQTLRRYTFLLERERRGEISNLKYRPRILLLPPLYRYETKTFKNGKIRTKEHLVQSSVFYIADFTYVRDNDICVEEVLPSNYVQNVKRKMMFSLNNTKVTLIKDPAQWTVVNKNKTQR